MLVVVVLFLARRRRIPQLWSLSRETARTVLEDRRSLALACWLSIVVLVIAAGFLGSLRPDVSFDGLAYHLPEIRDFAQRGQVEPLANIDVTLLWRNYDTFLGIGYLAGGERVVRLLHFFVGLAAFGSAVALSRRLGNRGSGALALLVLAACPAACAQLKETYVDLPAALFLTAAAVEIAASEKEPRRLWLGGFLFGGAVATKIFALLASVALLALMIRRHRASPRYLLTFALCAAIPLLPWFVWSQARFGFFLAPYSHAWRERSLESTGGVHIPHGQQTKFTESGAAGFFRFPYDRTFRSVRLVTDGGGFVGFLPLLLLVGVAGWGVPGFALFCAAALAALLPWHFLSNAQVIAPSIRFLVPLYPLYAVFAALGIRHLTGNFRGGLGAGAAVSLAALSIALPAQLLSAPFDAQIALGRVSREQALSAYLPAYPLLRHLQPGDRVLFLGGRDRYHCPAKRILTDTAVLRMTRDPNRVRDLLRRLRITHIVNFDQRRDLAEFKSIAACIERIDQHAHAALYRFDWEKQNCPAPRVREAEGPRAFEGPAKAAPRSEDRFDSRRADLEGGRSSTRLFTLVEPSPFDPQHSDTTGSSETSLCFRRRARAPCDYLGVNAQVSSVGYFAGLAAIA
jgi:hypothetical protein